MKQKPKVVLVTGGSRGIGAAIVKRFAEHGCIVHSLDLSEPNKTSTISGTIIRRLGDVSDPNFVASYCDELITKHGAVDILINNAGITPRKPNGKKALVEEWTVELWDEVLRVNLTAGFLFAKGLIAAMKEKRWGRIVNMSSQAGRTKSDVASACYSASKAALIGFSRTFAAEIAQHGITVNCIAPGRIDTPLAAVAGSALNRKYAAAIPVGRLGTPDDIASITAFLASEEASFLTGITIDANGGYYMQ
ncbi:MAG: SDR family oxidoreductase [Alphaproteobacteria bacterium]|nr:SDR family oxidoreductase [Alphaproteobacteria bacterium]